MSDVDGTLITKGDMIRGFPERLSEIVKEARQKGIGFSLASGRDQYAQQELWTRITEDAAGLKLYEAISYEDCQLLMGNGKLYSFGGLSSRTLALIDLIEENYREAFEEVVPLPGQRFTVRAARVTREFAAGRETNSAALNKAYLAIKNLVERLKLDPAYAPDLSTLHIGKSADAIDFLDQNSSKANLFLQYLEILNSSYSITSDTVLVLGDAANDQKMLMAALEKGGIAGYVGQPEQIAINGERLEEVLQSFAETTRGTLFIPSVRGPNGTVEVLEKLLPL